MLQELNKLANFVTNESEAGVVWLAGCNRVALNAENKESYGCLRKT